MKISNIILNISEEYPIYLEHIISSLSQDKKNWFEITDFCEINTRTWTYMNNIFLNSSIHDSRLAIFSPRNCEYKLLIHKHCLIHELDGIRTVLVLETNKNVYINKAFNTDYINVYKRFKKSTEEIIFKTDKDIIYTNLICRDIFYTFVVPKFKSISERKDYSHNLYNEFVEEKYKDLLPKYDINSPMFNTYDYQGSNDNSSNESDIPVSIDQSILADRSFSPSGILIEPLNLCIP